MPAQPAPTTRTSCSTSTTRTLANFHRLGFDDPERPVGAVEAGGAVHLGEARADEAESLAVAFEHGPALAERRHEAPRAHLPVHLGGGPRQVDAEIVVLELALILAALLWL